MWQQCQNNVLVNIPLRVHWCEHRPGFETFNCVLKNSITVKEKDLFWPGWEGFVLSRIWRIYFDQDEKDLFWPEWEGSNRDETYAFGCTGCQKTMWCPMTQNSKILFVTSLLRTSQALGLDTKVKTGTFCAHSLKPVNKYYKVKGAYRVVLRLEIMLEKFKLKLCPRHL